MNIRVSSMTAPLDPMQGLRRRSVQILALICILAALGGLTAQLAVAGQVGLSGPGIGSTSLLVLAGAFALVFVNRNRIGLASILLLGVLAIAMWLVNVIGALLVVAVLVIIAGAALTSPGVYILLNAAVFGRLIFEFLVVLSTSGTTPTVEGGILVSIISALVIISTITRYFIDTAENAVRIATRTASLLQGTAEIGQITAGILKLDELFNRAVDMIRDRFAFYHVQIFMIDDDRKYATLVASTGEIGQRLLERKHRLAVGSQSVIGRVTQIGEPVIASDTDDDPHHAANELLPNTRSELALPIIDGDQIIGALDVQSTRRDAFREDDIQALQALTSQLANAIRNVRLFSRQEESVRLNQRLLLEARTNLREIQRLNSQLSGEAWQAYLEQPDANASIRLDEHELNTNVQWTPEMVQAVDLQHPVSRVDDQGNRITAVPITLRGEILGAIEVAETDTRETELIEMVQAVAQNLAVTLDRARLFEEAQEATSQEQRINRIVERYQTAPTVDEMLKITVEELTRTLGAEHSAIRVGMMPGHPLVPAAGTPAGTPADGGRQSTAPARLPALTPVEPVQAEIIGTTHRENGHSVDHYPPDGQDADDHGVSDPGGSSQHD